MGIVIDSSILVAAERGRLDLPAIIQSYADEALVLAAITASELLHGVHRAVTPTQRATRSAFVEKLLSEHPIIPFDLGIARVHAEMTAELSSRGFAIGTQDEMIAATALALGYRVATRDARSFPRVAGLQVIRL